MRPLVTESVTALHHRQWSPDLHPTTILNMSKVSYSDCLKHGTYVGTFVTGNAVQYYLSRVSLSPRVAKYHL